MTEKHATLRLLRGNGDAPELAPAARSLPARAARRAAAPGRTGDRAHGEGQLRRLEKGVNLSAFRIIQEALTNVLKHAPGASTKVTLAYQPHGIELTVTDTDDEVHGMPIPGPSDGHGIIGMRERAALFRGTLGTEAVPGGFRVTAMLPYEAAVS